LIGKKHFVSRTKNSPGFSIGQPRSLNLNPETKRIFTGRNQTPSPSSYKVPTDNIKFRRNTVVEYKEPKFFEPTNMSKIKALVPIQYTGQNGAGPIPETNINSPSNGSKL